MAQQFQMFNHETDVRDRYYALRQTGNVSLYITRFRTLVIELEHEPEANKVYQFLKGLKPEIHARTRVLKPKTLTQAMDIADEADRANHHASKSRRWHSTADQSLENGFDADYGQSEAVAGGAAEPAEPMQIGAVNTRQGRGRRYQAC